MGRSLVMLDSMLSWETNVSETFDCWSYSTPVAGGKVAAGIRCIAKSDLKRPTPIIYEFELGCFDSSEEGHLAVNAILAAWKKQKSGDATDAAIRLLISGKVCPETS